MGQHHSMYLACHSGKLGRCLMLEITVISLVVYTSYIYTSGHPLWIWPSLVQQDCIQPVYCIKTKIQYVLLEHDGH